MKIAVIGSGIGGLASAYWLALKGHEVTVFEKNTKPGGKINELHINNYRFDTGPSLFTMPQLVDELLNSTIDNTTKFEYEQLNVVCKYFYKNGKTLNAFADTEKFKNECKDKFGEDPKNIAKYLTKAHTIYKLTANIFIFNSLSKFRNFLKLSVLKSLLQVHKIQFYQTMHASNKRMFSSPELVQLFNRYATYNGSNPYKAPATLNIIAHLENNLGAFFPKKGMYSIVDHIYRLCENQGVRFNFSTLVNEIVVKNKKAIAIKTGNKEIAFDHIVANSDVNYLAKKMIKNHPLNKRLEKLEPSSSALVFYWGIKKQFHELDLHNILFSANYKDEFKKMFDEKSLSSDPSIYIFVSSKLVKTDAPEGCENWFVMINAPYNDKQNWDELIKKARKNIIAKINTTLNTNIEDYIECESIASPESIEENTLSEKGALYGNSSNSTMSAFLRHPNFLKGIKNISFVGGSVHPGGGIPLCLAGAKIIEKEIQTMPNTHLNNN